MAACALGCSTSTGRVPKRFTTVRLTRFMLTTFVVALAGYIFKGNLTSLVTHIYYTHVKGMPSPPDHREERLMQHVLNATTPGDVVGIVYAMDQYGWEKEFVMSVGDQKGKILDQALIGTRPRPKKLLELGTYTGYSAMRIAANIPHDAHLYSVELQEKNARVARTLIEHAGLSGKVTVLEGTLSALLDELTPHAPFDFVFIDHHKAHYLTDLNLMKENGFLHAGTVVVADNLKLPGAPDYVAYMEGASDFDTLFHKSHVEYTSFLPDVVGVSVYKGPPDEAEVL